MKRDGYCRPFLCDLCGQFFSPNLYSRWRLTCQIAQLFSSQLYLTSAKSLSPRLSRKVWRLAREGREEVIEGMAIRVVRLGTTRHPKEGLRIGTVRRPPRGVRKTEYARRNYFDVWLPELFTPKRWAAYARRYRREMLKPASRRLIALLAALSSRTNFSVGCYCEDETRCHRSLLKVLLIEQGARVV